MSMPIQRQSDYYSAFDEGMRFAKDRTIRELPEGLVNATGPRITAGLLNTRESASFDDYGLHGRPGPVDPPSAYAPDTTEMREREQAQFDQHYGPGAEDPHYTEEAFREEPHSQLQPLHQLREEWDAPLPPEPHDHLAQFRPHLASFTEARTQSVEDGPAPVKEALAVSPQIAPQMVPGWIGHGYAPGHRVGLPWRQTVIPGTVTHLDGQEVGIRWDDGQHSTEEPKDLRPL